MKPMFLPGVENNPAPGPTADGIKLMQADNAEYPQIWHLFAYRPDVTNHLSRFTQEVMRPDGPLSAGMCELIAAYTSYGNDCPF